MQTSKINTKSKNTNVNTIDYQNYTIVSCLNERTIYMKITDRVAFLCYEGNIDEKDLRLSLDLETSYRLLCNCFSQTPEHEINITRNKRRHRR